MKDLYQRTIELRKCANPDVLDPSWFEFLRGAVVFTVKDDVVEAAVRLRADTKDGVKKVAPFARLPFPKVFIQWPAKAQYPAGAVMRPGAVYAPEWHGLLLVRADANGLDFSSGEVVIMPEDIVAYPVLEGDGGEFAIPAAVSAVIASHDLSQFSAASVCRPFRCPYLKPGAIPAAYTEEAAFGDIESEIALVPWLLAVINSPNLSAGRTVPRSTPPMPGRPYGELVKHHIVTLKISRVQQQRMGVSDQAGAAKRLHACRGHFKVRKTGIFWWNDFMRGNADVGSVTKSYTVAA